jgi:hypothetical protein
MAGILQEARTLQIEHVEPIRCLAHGFSVIPIEPRGKKPLIAWEPYQTHAPLADEIKTWWTKWPAANVGIVTGAVSGLVVLDIDTEAAKEKLKSIV